MGEGYEWVWPIGVVVLAGGTFLVSVWNSSSYVTDLWLPLISNTKTTPQGYFKSTITIGVIDGDPSCHFEQL